MDCDWEPSPTMVKASAAPKMSTLFLAPSTVSRLAIPPVQGQHLGIWKHVALAPQNTNPMSTTITNKDKHSPTSHTFHARAPRHALPTRPAHNPTPRYNCRTPRYNSRPSGVPQKSPRVTQTLALGHVPFRTTCKAHNLCGPLRFSRNCRPK